MKARLDAGHGHGLLIAEAAVASLQKGGIVQLSPWYGIAGGV